jgi:hypothetical protein
MAESTRFEDAWPSSSSEKKSPSTTPPTSTTSITSTTSTAPRDAAKGRDSGTKNNTRHRPLRRDIVNVRDTRYDDCYRHAADERVIMASLTRSMSNKIHALMAAVIVCMLISAYQIFCVSRLQNDVWWQQHLLALIVQRRRMSVR